MKLLKYLSFFLLNRADEDEPEDPFQEGEEGKITQIATFDISARFWNNFQGKYLGSNLICSFFNAIRGSLDESTRVKRLSSRHFKTFRSQWQ